MYIVVMIWLWIEYNMLPLPAYGIYSYQNLKKHVEKK